MKTIYINDKEIHQTGNPSVATLLQDHKITVQQMGIAVALNQIILPKENWAKTYPQDGDKITVIEAWQGG